MQTSDTARLHAGEVSAGAQKQQRRPEPWRVFFLLDSFMIGGTETQAVELARRLDPARYHVTVGCLRREGPLLERLAGTNLPIVHVDMGGGMSYTMVGVGEGTGGGMMTHPMPGQPAHWLPYVLVDDIVAATAKATTCTAPRSSRSTPTPAG